MGCLCQFPHNSRLYSCRVHIAYYHYFSLFDVHPFRHWLFMSQTVSDITFIVVAGTVLMLLMSGFIVFMVVMHRNRQLKNRHQLLQMQSNYEQAILHSRVEMQNQTFAYIGKELHDNLGQVLSLIKLNLASGTEDGVYNSRQLLATAIQDMRSLSKSLDLDWAENLSLSQFIRNELTKLNRTGEISPRFLDAATFDIENVQNRVIVFRIVQECLNNIMKHAGATELTVSLKEMGDKRLLEIRDNGRGFNGSEVSHGSGLLNIRQRAALIGAEVRWESQPGYGTNFVLSL